MLLVKLFDSFYTELKGIPSQSSVGFLTLLEAHRYCEVGIWELPTNIQS